MSNTSKIVIYQGESKTLEGLIVDGNGDVFDGTGYVIHFVARLNGTVVDAIGPFASDDGVPQTAWVDATLGTYTVSLLVADTTSLVVGSYDCEVRIIDGAAVETIVEFTLEIKASKFV